MTPPRIVAYRRRRTGTPQEPSSLKTREYWLSKWSIATYALILMFVASSIVFAWDLMRSREQEDGTKIPGLNGDALREAAGYAIPTLCFWIVLFFLVNRFRTWNIRVVLLTLGWGACLAVCAAYFINTWAGTKMAVVDATSGVDAVRTAVFVAPFIEEFFKGCVVFLIATLDRNRFVSRVSGAVLGGLVGAGFAFTENIVYYARVIVYGSYTSGAGDVATALHQIVMLRGVYTCFGHPLFTLMTGVGVAFGVAARSKIVRVVAPVTGFLAAALLHMLFNGLSSIMDQQQLIYVYLLIGLPLFIVVLMRVIMSAVRQGRTVSARVTDYVMMGWLPESYQTAFSTLRRRAWTLIMSLWHGNIVKTWQLQHAVTELAFVRESITRGTIDDGGLWRERELIDKIKILSQTNALVDGTGLRPYWPWTNFWRRRRAKSQPSRRYSAPRGAETSLVPLKYSAVDPRWGPPA